MFGLVSIISLELSLSVTLSIKKMGFCWWVQRVKKVVSYSLRLLDFAIGLVNSVVNLPDGQVKFFEEFEWQKNCEINLLIKTFLGLVEMMFGLSKCWLQLAQMASCKNVFLCTLWVILYLLALFVYACTCSLILWCIIFYTKTKSFKNILAIKFWLLESNSYLFNVLLILQWLLSNFSSQNQSCFIN